MRLGSISGRSGRRWWWAFILLIATPALALALLGLRVVRLEELERGQEMRTQWAQLTRLADATITTTLASLQRDATGVETSRSEDCISFALELSGRLVFEQDKTFLPDPAKSEFQLGPHWPKAIQQLIERAQIGDQQRMPQAASLVQQVGHAEPRLRPWAELVLARQRYESGDTEALAVLANPVWSRSEGVTPTGLPAAFLAADYVEGIPAGQRERFVPLLQATLDGLRAGRWWLTYEERNFYDGEIRRLIKMTGLPTPAQDPRLADWISIEHLVRQVHPSTSPSDLNPAAAYLIIWSRRLSGAWNGTAIPRSRLTGLIGSGLNPLFSNQLFGAAVSQLKGSIIWSHGFPRRDGPTGITMPLRAVEGWELVFWAPDRSALDLRRLLWYGFTLLMVMTMAIGLAVTLYVIKREVELTGLQSDFVAAVTHEFKSPITSIRLLMERLSGGKLRTPAAVAEYHDAINRETDRLERLVNRVLESQKIQSGEKQYTLAWGSIVRLAESTIWKLRPQAEAKRIAIDLELTGEIPDIRMDPTAIGEALDNLLDNAIKYSSHGARVAIRIEERDSYLCVDVQDEGVGIDPDDLPRIFDRFYRGRHGDLQNVHGTGLGLALVKAAAEGHGGAVEVSSTPGQGARFRLRLRLEE